MYCMWKSTCDTVGTFRRPAAFPPPPLPPSLRPWVRSSFLFFFVASANDPRSFQRTHVATLYSFPQSPARYEPPPKLCRLLQLRCGFFFRFLFSTPCSLFLFFLPSVFRGRADFCAAVTSSSRKWPAGLLGPRLIAQLRKVAKPPQPTCVPNSKGDDNTEYAASDRKPSHIKPKCLMGTATILNIIIWNIPVRPPPSASKPEAWYVLTDALSLFGEPAALASCFRTKCGVCDRVYLFTYLFACSRVEAITTMLAVLYNYLVTCLEAFSSIRSPKLCFVCCYSCAEAETRSVVVVQKHLQVCSVDPSAKGEFVLPGQQTTFVTS